MSTPVRFTSGFTQSMKQRPLGNIGIPDPLFYCSFHDDFFPYIAAPYTVTASGGSVAATTGFGGWALFTTGATAGNFASIQNSAAALQYQAGQKMAFLTRLQVASATTSAFVAGLIPTTATPFGTITDGIYFIKAAGATTLTVNIVSASAVIGSAVLSGLLSDATNIDLGFYLDDQGNLSIFAADGLEGAVKNQNTATFGPQAKILFSNLTGSFSAASLTPTLAVSNGTTAAAMTMSSDFLFAASER